MPELPATLEEAIAQAQSATQAAISAGYSRLQIELLLPELKPMPVALQYLSVFEDLGSDLKVFFSDAGAAALARRDWGNVACQIGSLDVAGSRQTTPVEELVAAEDRAFLFVAPSSVEILPVEQVCNAAVERPSVLFNPRLEDMGTVGIGFTARNIRKRFLETFEPCYFLRPLDRAVMLRCYPSPWQIWLETGEDAYQLIAEERDKPDAERLDAIMAQAMGSQQAPKRGFLTDLQRLLKALGQ
ncbi:DUF1995 family protein [Kovacikia minuta CCNUW1]|uniref:DUF1995 family protein n=1 Tax=Kovacikia minuta TaxID=2931930 RepID=UPI001CC912AD|nr:DUF1995 family protein [Kovacikia minuta]UBF26198.1 DUF1995 family protein [Kovacikia minuta CCNUW1]